MGIVLREAVGGGESGKSEFNGGPRPARRSINSSSSFSLARSPFLFLFFFLFFEAVKWIIILAASGVSSWRWKFGMGCGMLAVTAWTVC